MGFFSKITTFIALVGVLTLSPALAANKFPNKDTAKDRQNVVTSTAGAKGEEEVIVIEKDKKQTVIKTKRPKKEEKDWNDNIYMVIEPEIKTD